MVALHLLMCSFMETAKLNGINAEAYLRYVLSAIVEGLANFAVPVIPSMKIESSLSLRLPKG